MTKFLKIFLLSLLPALLALAFVPWKSVLENKLTAMLHERGLQDVRLKVAGLGLQGITLKEIALAGTPVLENITIGYSLPRLLRGGVEDMVVSGLALRAEYGKKGWQAGGLERLWEGGTGGSALRLPVEAAQLAVPFNTARIEKSSLHVESPQGQWDIPFQLTWRKASPEIAFSTPGLAGKSGNNALATGAASAALALDEKEKQWRGSWRIADIALKAGDISTPPLRAEGTAKASTNEIRLEGSITSADKTYLAEFNAAYSLETPAKSRLTVARAMMPWSGGIVSARGVQIPLQPGASVNAEIRIEKVSLNDVMQLAAGKQAAATGSVSGTIPVTLKTDGGIAIHNASLSAVQPGVIKVPPEAIAGDNAQVELVRDVLKNLHYSALSVQIDSTPDNRMSVKMALEGNNPDVYSGKPVKLNVHLTGDVLNLIRQNMEILSAPESLLEPEK